MRSVYVHFDDLEDLFCAASERQGKAIADLLVPVANTGPFEQRLNAFVAQRSAVWEAIGPVRIAAMLQEPFSPGLAALLASTRTTAKRDLCNVFSQEISAMAPDDVDTVVAACDSFASSTSWDHWRRYQQRGVEDAQNILATGLRLLLGGKHSR